MHSFSIVYLTPNLYFVYVLKMEYCSNFIYEMYIHHNFFIKIPPCAKKVEVIVKEGQFCIVSAA